MTATSTIYVWNRASQPLEARMPTVKHEWVVEHRGPDGQRRNQAGPFGSRGSATIEAHAMADRARTPDAPVNVSESVPPPVVLEKFEKDDGFGVFATSAYGRQLGVRRAREVFDAATSEGGVVAERAGTAPAAAEERVDALWAPGGTMHELAAELVDRHRPLGRRLLDGNAPGRR